ncbi:MAG: hypothetical protein NT031_13140 [Planctomycetota bacterium]|nr:hypothetical protein [Planctomycetota bacterium]
MQYTASSFAHSIVSLFRRVLRPRTAGPVVHGAFPATTTMHTHVDEPVLDGLLLPGGRALGERLRWFHRFQQGLTQHYVLYILIAVMALLATLVPYEAILRRLLAL